MADLIETIGSGFSDESGEIIDLKGWLEAGWSEGANPEAHIIRERPNVFPERPQTGVRQVTTGGLLESVSEPISAQSLASTWGGGVYRVEIHAGLGQNRRRMKIGHLRLAGDPTAYPVGGVPTPINTETLTQEASPMSSLYQVGMQQAQQAQMQQILSANESAMAAIRHENESLRTQLRDALVATDARVKQSTEPFSMTMEMIRASYEAQINSLRDQLRESRENSRRDEDRTRDNLRAEYAAQIESLKRENEILRTDSRAREDQARQWATQAAESKLTILEATLAQIREENSALRKERMDLQTIALERQSPTHSMDQVATMMSTMEKLGLGGRASAEPTMGIGDKIMGALPQIMPMVSGIVGKAAEAKARESKTKEEELKLRAQELAALQRNQELHQRQLERDSQVQTQVRALPPPEAVQAPTQAAPTPPPTPDPAPTPGYEGLTADADAGALATWLYGQYDNGVSPADAVKTLAAHPAAASVLPMLKDVSVDEIADFVFQSEPTGAFGSTGASRWLRVFATSAKAV